MTMKANMKGRGRGRQWHAHAFRHALRHQLRHELWHARNDPAGMRAALEEHRRDVEEYLADLSERIRRLPVEDAQSSAG